MAFLRASGSCPISRKPTTVASGPHLSDHLIDIEQNAAAGGKTQSTGKLSTMSRRIYGRRRRSEDLRDLFDRGELLHRPTNEPSFLSNSAY